MTDMENEPTIVAQLEALTAEKAKFAADLDAANALLTETNGKLQAALTENAELADAVNKAKTDAEASKAFGESQTAALEAAKTESATIKAELEAANAKLSLKAFGDIAGREPIAGAGGDTGTNEDLWAAYAAIKDPAKKREFYLKNIKPTLG